MDYREIDRRSSMDLLGEEDFPNRIGLPYENEDWVEVRDLEDGREAYFESSGDFQIHAREYDINWKKTEMDFTYFEHPNYEINRKIDRYRQKI